jgi:hypothetical protein
MPSIELYEKTILFFNLHFISLDSGKQNHHYIIVIHKVYLCFYFKNIFKKINFKEQNHYYTIVIHKRNRLGTQYKPRSQKIFKNFFFTKI